MTGNEGCGNNEVHHHLLALCLVISAFLSAAICHPLMAPLYLSSFLSLFFFMALVLLLLLSSFFLFTALTAEAGF